jgi:hypothetical protein
LRSLASLIARDRAWLEQPDPESAALAASRGSAIATTNWIAHIPGTGSPRIRPWQDPRTSMNRKILCRRASLARFMLGEPAMVRPNPSYGLRITLLFFGSALALPGLFAAACVSSTQIQDTDAASSSSGAGGADSLDDGRICVLHNCKSDSDCGACSEGRKRCNVREHRCVTCDVVTGLGCREGDFCSDFGSCVPKGLTCDVDVHGVPLFECVTSVDCAACDPAHQVCDEAARKCVACTEQNTDNCARGETCTPERVCAAMCPTECSSPDECAVCATAEGESFDCVGKLCVKKSAPDGGTTDDGGTTTGKCCHDVCALGDAMTTSCNSCIKAVCSNDAYCCTTAWDSVCVTEVGEFCSQACTAPPTTCAHAESIVGPALDPKCSVCAGKVCAGDSYCCEVKWDSFCVDDVLTECGVKCQ